LKRLCGNCERLYEEEEAPAIIMYVKGVARLMPVRVCPFCGCPEHSGVPNNQWEKRFHKIDYVKIKEGTLKVSTINLMMAYDERRFWETMIFDVEGLKLEHYPMWRYETKEEAIKNHERIVQLLKKGKYKLIPKSFRLELEGLKSENPFER